MGWRRWAECALLMLVIGATYGNSLSGPFLFDDQSYIVDNPSIRRLWPPTWLGEPLGHRPVAALSFAVNHALAGLESTAFRAGSLLVHLLAAAVLWALLRRLPAPLPAIALPAALLWGVHPLNSECIHYVSQRTDLLMGLCALLTLYGAVRRFGGGAPVWEAIAVGCCALGMGSKESMAAVPLLVLLVDRTFYAGDFAAALRERAGLYGGLAATWAIVAHGLWSRPHGDTIGLGLGVTAWDYLLSQSQMLCTYLARSLWPHPLVFDYGPARAVGLGEAWLPALLIVALLALAGVALRRWPAWGLLGAWFFLLLAPTSSVVPIVSEVGAERRMYLPLVGLVVAAVLAGRALVGAAAMAPGRGAVPRGRSWLSTGLVALTAGVLGLTTRARSEDYESAVRIWRTVVEVMPANPRGHVNLAAALEREGNVAAAEARYREALAVDERFAEAHAGLGALLGAQGRRAEALDHLRTAARLRPRDARAQVNLGIALRSQGHIEEATARYRRALELEPTMAQAHFNLGNALAEAGDLAGARQHYRQALATRPDYPAARRNLRIVSERLEGPR